MPTLYNCALRHSLTITSSSTPFLSSRWSHSRARESAWAFLSKKKLLTHIPPKRNESNRPKSSCTSKAPTTSFWADWRPTATWSRTTMKRWTTSSSLPSRAWELYVWRIVIWRRKSIATGRRSSTRQKILWRTERIWSRERQIWFVSLIFFELSLSFRQKLMTEWLIFSVMCIG